MKNGYAVERLINVAGADIQKGFAEYSQEKIAFQARVNFEGAVSLCRIAIECKDEEKTLEILRKLGLQKVYKGCEYIISCINFIATNETGFTPVTKVLYIEVAKQYNTSSICVEKNIRSVIKKIWSTPENSPLISKIFSEHYTDKQPGNIEFLTLLHRYVKLNSFKNYDDYTFICPHSGTACEICKDFILETLNQIK